MNIYLTREWVFSEADLLDAFDAEEIELYLDGTPNDEIDEYLYTISGEFGSDWEEITIG